MPGYHPIVRDVVDGCDIFNFHINIAPEINHPRIMSTLEIRGRGNT